MLEFTFQLGTFGHDPAIIPDRLAAKLCVQDIQGSQVVPVGTI
jgi:hypothetical protein